MCKHEMIEYVGLNEVFEYCKLCNLKESEIQAAALKDRDSGTGGRACFNFITPIVNQLEKRLGYSSWPAATGAFDECFDQIAADLKADLEKDSPLELKGLEAWLPTKEETEKFYQCICGDPTAGPVCYSPTHRNEKPQGIDSEAALRYQYDYTTPWYRLSDFKLKSLDPMTVMEMGKIQEEINRTTADLYRSMALTGEAKIFVTSPPGYSSTLNYVYGLDEAEEEFNAVGTVVSVDRHLGYVTIKLDDIEKYKDLEVNNRLYMDREEE